ncbi:ribosomal protein S5 domain 2-type protein [Mycena galericulata]|nr:ribosomal protein S5 domain 2-type protein [Mycena galericulata]
MVLFYSSSSFHAHSGQGSRVEILNDGGFRSDGRRQYELRDMTIDLSQQGVADGSAIITHGLTQVLVSVFGPREAKMRSQTMHDRANLNVELSVAAFSTGERRKRSRGDKRILEMAATIKSTFEPVVQTSLYPRSQIDIFVQVLQQDGGLLQACINGATLALANAGIPLLDFVCAVTGGVHSTSPMLDLTLLEENDIPHVTVAVMPKTGKVTLVTMETRLHVERFEEIFRLACEAGKVIHTEMKGAVRERTGRLVGAMGSGPRTGGGDFQDDDAMDGV